MAENSLKTLKKRVQKDIQETQNLKELDEVFKKYIGKRGALSLILRSLKKLPEAKKVKIGKEANELKDFLKEKFDEKSQEIKSKAIQEMEEKEWIDITVPGKKPVLGHLHPLTQTQRKAEEIFQAMGFEVVEGPEIETEWYNFDALNIPKEHPVRDRWDTFWLKSLNRAEKHAEQCRKFRRNSAVTKDKVRRSLALLLRTHTSPVQIRYMEKHNPPLRIIIPGRVFRHEATNASHETNFHHIEGLMVDKNITAANFKAIVLEFLKRYFGKPVKIRLRPSFFPFTEPSFEVDVSCLVCGGRGCSTCQKTGWIEMMGAGMVHPTVFKNSGLNPKDWQGFAFGIGMDRMAMMKYKINEIRLFFSGDLRFLQQF